MKELILSLNPGSTSTKVALYRGETMLFDSTIRHSAEKIAEYDAVIDQRKWREEMILEEFNHRAKEFGVELSQLSAIVGRGGLVKPIAGGVYEINDALLHDTINAKEEHACNLGAPIAHSIADTVNDLGGSARAFIVDPVVVDEMDEVARVGGHPLMPRRSVFHALNTKAVAHRYAKERGCSYESLNLIVAHMGGGVTVCAHRDGRVVDTYNALSGEGAFSPERCGAVEPMALVDVCFSGEYTKHQIEKMLVGEGGLVAHLGINSMAEAIGRVGEGDEKATLIAEAFIYNVAKNIGSMSCALAGDVDAIIVTGGIAYNDYIIERLTERVKWIADVVRYPGEDELEALTMGGLGALRGEREVKIYK